MPARMEPVERLEVFPSPHYPPSRKIVASGRAFRTRHSTHMPLRAQTMLQSLMQIGVHLITNLSSRVSSPDIIHLNPPEDSSHFIDNSSAAEKNAVNIPGLHPGL